MRRETLLLQATVYNYVYCINEPMQFFADFLARENAFILII